MHHPACGFIPPPHLRATGSWLLPVLGAVASDLRAQTLPVTALRVHVVSSFFFKGVHLLDNCIFIFLSQTRKKCIRFSCIVYKAENKQKI